MSVGGIGLFTARTGARTDDGVATEAARISIEIAPQFTPVEPHVMVVPVKPEFLTADSMPLVGVAWPVSAPSVQLVGGVSPAGFADVTAKTKVAFVVTADDAKTVSGVPLEAVPESSCTMLAVPEPFTPEAR